MALFRKALVAAAFARLYFAAEEGVATKQLNRGDKDYYTEFAGITSPAGKLIPGFLPDHYEYTLKIEEATLVNVSLQFTLDNSNYFPSQEPGIEIDDETVIYNPFNVIQKVFQLNETIGKYDKKVSVRIFDPNNQAGAHIGNFGQTGNSHTYTIRIMQGPEYDKITKATGIEVSTSENQRVDYMSGSPRLNNVSAYEKGAESRVFVFQLNESEDGQSIVTTVKVVLKCPDMPGTSVLYEGVKYKVGQPIDVDVSKEFTTNTQFVCVYEDDDWANPATSTTYTIVFKETVTDIKKCSGLLKMVETYGWCESLPLLNDPNNRLRFKGWHGNLSNATRGFLCRADGNSSTVVALLSDRRVYADLIWKVPTGNTSHNTSMKLATGVKAQIPTPERQLFTMRVVAGNMEKEYPVLIFQPQHCADWPLPLPTMAYRDRDPLNARTWLCQEKECGVCPEEIQCNKGAQQDEDERTCFGPREPCTSFKGKCDAGQMNKGAAGTCQFVGRCDDEEDKEFCCGIPDLRGEQVNFNNYTAVVVRSYTVNGKGMLDVVVESTTGLAGNISADSVTVIPNPKFEVGEHVLQGERKGVITSVHDGLYTVVFYNPPPETTLQGAQPSQLKKDADWWISRNEVQGKKGWLECLEWSPVSYVALIDNKVVTIDGAKVKEMKRVPYFTKGQSVSISGKQGSIAEDCGGVFGKCSGKFQDGSSFGPVQDSKFAPLHVVMHLPSAPEQFSPGEIVYIDKSAKAKVEECGPAECRITKVPDGTHARVPLSLIAKEVNLKKDDTVYHGGKQGKIMADCNNVDPCSVEFEDKTTLHGISAMLLIPSSATFHVDEVVMVHDRRGIIEGEHCGAAKLCVVHLQDLDAPLYSVPGQMLSRPEAFEKGTEVIAEQRQGKIVDACNSASTCKVDFNGKVEDTVQTKDIIRIGSLRYGEEARVDGRMAVVLGACRRDELCPVKFLDDQMPIDGERAYSAILEQNGWLPGAEFDLDGKRGVIIERVTEEKFVVAVHETVDGEVKSDKSAKEVPVSAHSMPTGMQIEWDPLPKEDIQPSRVNDPFMPLQTTGKNMQVRVGDRVMVADRVGIVSSIDDGKYILKWQDNGDESEQMERSAFSLSAAERLVGDRVRYKGLLGTVTEVHTEAENATCEDEKATCELAPRYRVTMDSDQSVTALLQAQSCPLERQWFQIGDEVVLGGKRVRVETVDLVLGAYVFTFWSDQKHWTGPMKSWQVASSAAYYGHNFNLVPGDEVRMFKEQGVVISGPDADDSFKVVLFNDFDTELLVQGEYLTKVVNTQEFVSYQCKVDDKVKCTAGDQLGKVGTVVENPTMGSCTVHFDGEPDKDTHQILPSNLECVAQTLALKELVFTEGRSAEIIYGPDNLGRYAVQFLKTGETNGPYTFCQLKKSPEKPSKRRLSTSMGAAVLGASAIVALVGALRCGRGASERTFAVAGDESQQQGLIARPE